VFALPFDSGHVLALRVFPQSTFGPYRTVWHRDPAGAWSIFGDAPDLANACPRYYGSACQRVGHATIGLEWTRPRELHVTMDEPALSWSLTAHATPTLATLNAMSARMPLASWRPEVLLRARTAMARRLGMGDLELAGTMPSGHHGLLMPQRMYFVDDAHATLDGQDLGSPAHLQDNPSIGDVPLPARGVLAIGQAVWPVLAEPGATTAIPPTDSASS
jgi:hypothetical protein